MAKSKVLRQCCLVAVSLAAIGSASLAAVSNEDIIAAINNQKILAAGSRMNVKLAGEHLTISTYRQTKETDKTNKVQAILIAKAVIDMAPSITRVSVCFFDSTSMSKYKQVDVTAGDVKAYTGDQLTLDQLLSSVEIKDAQLSDEAGKISSYLDSRKPEYPVVTVINKEKNEAILNTKIESWASELQCKYTALKLANEFLDVKDSNVGVLRVDFADPTDGSIREISFETGAIKGLVEKMENALAPVSIVSRRAVASAGTVSEGVLKQQRTELSERIKKLAASGVGVGPFWAAFQRMEELVATGDQTRVDAEIKKLNGILDTQEKAAKDAKTSASTSTKKDAATCNAPPVQMTRKVSRWALGGQPILEARVLREPEVYINELEAQTNTPTLKAVDNPKFYSALEFFAQTLRLNSRPDDAAKIEQRIAAIRVKHPTFAGPAAR